jgi:1-acyl-sn-glycerol-3-phosphate acyltransferase
MHELAPIRMVLLKTAIAATTVLLGTVAVVAGLWSRRAAARVTHVWASACLRFIGAPVRVEGLGNLVPGRRYVIMANHESSLDILVLLDALPASLEPRFLAKRSLFAIPFLGWAMRAAGFVPVDREDRSTAAATFSETLAVIERGGSPLIFPEQTWTSDGALLPFQRGGFLVALKSGLDILPVGLEGTRLVLPPGDGRIFSHPVTVRVGSAIPTADRRTREREELTAQTRRAIDRLRGPLGHIPDPDHRSG